MSFDNSEEKFRKKRRGKLQRSVTLLQDNAPAHSSHVAVGVVSNWLPNSSPSCLFPRSPPSYFYLFPRLKSELRGCESETDEEVIGVVEEFLGVQDKAWFLEGLTMLEKRWTKCIELKGDYVETLWNKIFGASCVS
ncbi:uncharacterized protein LOC121379723 [Gigantopelta aegis]|uniref:uncharacterized protein LOC121379723 n=1 Tax=Gigantopelta aegis TaxID=1735272 RepID=UPI001B88DC40|nr:uncharacterized protein LOC121379723 [Gigantopelta aegis]